MLSTNAKQWMLSAASAALLMSFSFATHADGNYKPRKTNINVAVASNFYGVPPSNSAITYSVFRLAARCTDLCGWIPRMECAAAPDFWTVG